MNLPKIIKLKPRNFWFIFAIILVLPVAKEYQYLLFGERLEGTVVGVKKTNNEIGYLGQFVYSEIEYFIDGQRMTFKGPENIRYEIGEKLPLIVLPGKPEKVIIATFSGFYIDHRSIGLIIVLIIWLAIYTTLREQHK